jgi:transcriptional regulator with XRE-family HTH domain
MNLREAVGHKIRQIRRAAGLTQSQLAEQLGRQEETVSAIERGINMPSEDTLIGLSRVFDLPVHCFFEVGNLSAKDQVREALIAEILTQCRLLNDDNLQLLRRQIEAFSPAPDITA